MDWQTAFNISAGMLAAVGGWFLKMIHESQKELRRDLGALQTSLPEVYARRDDLSDIINRLFTKLDRIEDKLDGKADK